MLRPVEFPLNECFDCGVRWGGGPRGRGAGMQGRRGARAPGAARAEACSVDSVR